MHGFLRRTPHLSCVYHHSANVSGQGIAMSSENSFTPAMGESSRLDGKPGASHRSPLLQDFGLPNSRKGEKR
jgi:hypothetical protein